MHHRNIDEAEDAHDRGEAGGLAAGLGEAAHHQVAGVDDPEHQRRGKPRVPGPERAPDRLRPDHPHDQSHSREDEPDQGCRAGEPVRGGVLLPQVDDAPDEHHREAAVGRDGRADVQVKDPLHGALQGVGRRKQEDEASRDEHQRYRRGRTLFVPSHRARTVRPAR